jgi:two-component system, cell cycle response regulator
MTALAAPELRVPSMDELEAICRKLPPPPGLVLQILHQADDERASVASLARTIGKDAGLASNLLRLANSSLVAPVDEITTIERAVTMLGLRSVKLLALSSTMGVLLSRGGGGRADTVLVRRRSLVNAVLSRQFVPPELPLLADEAFVVGLVGHLGRLALAQGAPPVFSHLVGRGNGWSRADDERELLGVSGDELTALLLQTWGLPTRLSEVIRLRSTRAQEPPPDLAPVVHASRLALLGEEVLCGTDRGPSLQQLRSRAADVLGLSWPEVDQRLLETEPVLAEIADLLRLDLPAGTSHEDLVAEAVSQIAMLSAGTAAELSEGRRLTRALSEENHRLSTQTRLDFLTGLANRAALDDFLGRHLAARARRQLPAALGLLMIDLDQFKTINDGHGHPVGDEVLRAVGALLERTTRRDEFAARYGGEEFVLVLPHTTVEELSRAAERIRVEIAELSIPARVGPVALSASVGGALTARATDPDPARELISRADVKLYEAKRAGRNTCRIDPLIP